MGSMFDRQVLVRIPPRALVSIFAISLCACGGGGDSSNTAASNVSPGGIWRGTDSITGDQMLGLVTESGKFHFIRADGVQFVGNSSTSGNSLSASYDALTQYGYAFPDGTTHGAGTISATVQQRSSINGTVQFHTDAGNPASGSFSLTFDPLYNRPSSLATISGTFTDPNTGVVVTIGGDGSIFYQDPASGCVLNGSVSIINSSYNAYDVQFTLASCQGQYAALNNIQFSGLATLDNTRSPEVAVFGVNGQSGTTKYALVRSYNRM